MTEPQAGADPQRVQVPAERDGDEWVINGEKWFSSNCRYARSRSSWRSPTPTCRCTRARRCSSSRPTRPGIEIVRNVGLGGEPRGRGPHAYVRYNDVRVPAENLLGGEGQAFVIAQTRLGGGRIHHAMRTVGMCQRAFDMMCERALSRATRRASCWRRSRWCRSTIADSWIQLHQFRLLVLHAAWMIDQVGRAQGRAPRSRR